MEDYKENVKLLYRRASRFFTKAKLLFHHMDWDTSNIILHHNLDSVAAIIDRKMSGFMPDPQDMYSTRGTILLKSGVDHVAGLLKSSMEA